MLVKLSADEGKYWVLQYRSITLKYDSDVRYVWVKNLYSLESQHDYMRNYTIHMSMPIVIVFQRGLSEKIKKAYSVRESWAISSSSSIVSQT